MLVTWDDRMLDCGVDDQVVFRVLWYNRVLFLEICSVLTVGKVKGYCCRWKSVGVIVGVDCGVECGVSGSLECVLLHVEDTLYCEGVMCDAL